MKPELLLGIKRNQLSGEISRERLGGLATMNEFIGVRG
jgi:hypothetical protein